MARSRTLLLLLVVGSLLFSLSALAQKPKTPKGDTKDDLEFEPDEIERSGPASKTLDRAKKLYDRKEYYTASIEFDKVIKKETEDSAANRQRAEFFMGKTLYHMRFYAASLGYFEQIVNQGPAHKYYRRTLQWLAALSKVLPESADILKKIGVYSKEDLEDPALESVRNELYFLLGRYYYHGADIENNLEQAIALFQAVPRESEFYLPAKFFEAVSWVLVPKGANAIDALREILVIAREPGSWKPANIKPGEKAALIKKYEELANLTMARVFYSTKQYDLAIKYFERINENSAEWLESLFEASWAYYQKKLNSKALGNILTLNAPYFEGEFFPESHVLQAVIYFNYCNYDQALESVADFIGTYSPLRDEIRKIVELNPEDNAAFFQYVKKIRDGSADKITPEVLKLAGAALGDKTLGKTYAWVAELEREIAQHERSDKAWKTTRVASEVLQNLEVAKSLAEDRAGQLSRERLDSLANELSEFNADARSVKLSIMEARIGNKKEALLGAEFTTETKQEAIEVDDEHETWAFDGEYWRDELGFYRYKLTPKCPKRR